MGNDKVKGTPCEKCYDGTYGAPAYKEFVAGGYAQEGLVYFCNGCGHRKVTQPKPPERKD